MTVQESRHPATLMAVPHKLSSSPLIGRRVLLLHLYSSVAPRCEVEQTMETVHWRVEMIVAEGLLGVDLDNAMNTFSSSLRNRCKTR